jgi:predicted TIM-barrel fold metal-dependent hydrolase
MRSRIIDSHCHTFGAEDLPMYGFLKCSILSDYPELDNALVRSLAKFLTWLMKWIAPSTKSERRRLLRLLDEYRNDMSELMHLLIKMVDIPEGDEPTDLETKKAIEKGVEKLSESDDQGDLDLLDQLKRAAFGDDQIDGAPSRGQIMDIARALLAGKGEDYISGGLALVGILVRYRYKITQKHIKDNLFASKDNYYDEMSESGKNYFISPLVVDYDKWVNDEAKAMLSDQIEVMVLNNRLHQGRLLPFVPFDPWREIVKNDELFDPLKLVKTAIEEEGFIGVKIYPPMGFWPIGNTDMDNDHYPEGVPPQFGKKVDDVLHQIYSYCQQNCVPITTHCSRSMGTADGYDDRAHPKYWGKVADKFEGIKINLGHFGGNDWWEYTVVDLAKKHSNVYADLSYASYVLDRSEWEYRIGKLREHIDGCDNENQDAMPYHIKDKMMFGTDWSMLCLVEGYENYLNEFEGFYAEVVDNNAEDMEKFFFGNAVKFFGLDNSDVRDRLRTFHDKYKIKSPFADIPIRTTW